MLVPICHYVFHFFVPHILYNLLTVRIVGSAAYSSVMPWETAAAEAGTSSSKDDIIGGSVEAKRNKLVFFEGGIYSFDLEDLLRDSAEVLGKGSAGTSYKAVLEEGTTLVVKRLKDVAVTKKEFDSQMEILGKIKHDNVVPLRAYYFSNDEKLLVYDYLPSGSLSALLHVQNNINTGEYIIVLSGRKLLKSMVHICY